MEAAVTDTETTTAAPEQAAEEQPRKRRGRPPGSKNKPRPESASDAPKTKPRRRSNGAVVTGFQLTADTLTLTTDKGEQQLRIGRPSLLLDLHYDAKQAVQDLLQT